jgi:hypothetical protein
MTDKQTAAKSAEGNAEKDPADWVTGDEPMTGAQKSYLKTLSEEAKVDFDDTLTKARASERIDELQRATGRGKQPRHGDAPVDTNQSVAGEEDPGASLDIADADQ